MPFNQCCICGLNLPISVMQPIKVKHQGKIIIVGICDRCKELREQVKQKEN
jgi:hypothetical protein